MNFWSRLVNRLRGGPVPPLPEPTPPANMLDWFVVRFDDVTVSLDVHPPGHTPWTANFKWTDVQRVCYEATGIFESDGIFVFTSLRPESFGIPTEANGGSDFVGQLAKRGLFPAELLLQACSTGTGQFWWPPVEDQARSANP